MVANHYNKKKLAIAEHEANGDIVVEPTVEDCIRLENRNYVITYIRDEKEHQLRLSARDLWDAKYKAFVQHNIELTSILSVV